MAHRLASLLVALALCLSAGCRDSSGSSVDEPAQVSDEEAVATLVEGLSGEWNVADVLVPWRSLTEMLPTVTFNVADGPQMSASDVIVVGEVSSVERGRALIYDLKFDGTPPTKVPWDDPDAMYRSIEVTMSVNEIIGPSDGVGDTVTWETGVGPPSTFDVYAQGWQGIGPMAVFLSRGDFTPPGVYEVAGNGSLVLPLDGEQLTFPVLGGPDQEHGPVASEWFDGIKTLDDLRTAVDEGPKTIDVGPSPNFER
jgi:hypothetical protein